MSTRFFEIQQVIPPTIPQLEPFLAYLQTDHIAEVYVVSQGFVMIPISNPLPQTAENDITLTPPVCINPEMELLESEITRDRIWLSRSGWEVVKALGEAGFDGLTIRELASKVAKWTDKIPSREAVQRMVSRISCKFADHNIPFRGRSENFNLSPNSKRRRRDGRFRAYLSVITA